MRSEQRGSWRRGWSLRLWATVIWARRQQATVGGGSGAMTASDGRRRYGVGPARDDSRGRQ
jgi:hypothetical protein